jgi:hypothetical protein
MIYGFSLPGVGFTVGTALIAVHVFALLRQQDVIPWLQRFPRSKSWGVALCSLAAVWALWMAATMDLGEFSPNRTLICGVILAGAFMVPLFADEFLAVRATGILALLAAEPLLEAAFLRPEQTRLLLVVLAYLLAIGGLLLVGAPYLMRDAIQWISAGSLRYRALAISGVLYGAALVLVSWLFFSP